VLSDAELELDDVDGVAVSAGPGSFTGLRIGTAFAKGLAFAGGIPLIGVPTMEAHASLAACHAGTLVCVANDARKGEVYAALFEVRSAGEVERCWPDGAWEPIALLRALPRDAVLAGDACDLLARRDPARSARHRCTPLVPSGGTIARLGTVLLTRGERASVGDFSPTYVRAPDATLPSLPLR